jgi:ribosomal protein S18 acetylase RimI-like enzyme
MSATVRKATEADIAAIVAVDSFAADHPHRIGEITAWVEAGQCFVAEGEGRVIGYAVLTHGFFHQPFVEMLTVAADARRNGMGELLLQHLAAHVGGRLWTSTNASNTPMRALLMKAGFIESGVVENLDPGDPEVIYLLDR